MDGIREATEALEKIGNQKFCNDEGVVCEIRFSSKHNKNYKTISNFICDASKIIKATKIIADKCVDIASIKHFTKVEDYNVGLEKDQQLTPEEFNIVEMVVKTI